MGEPKTSYSILREYLERLKVEWIAETVPLRPGVPGMSQPELPQDPETWKGWFQVLRRGGSEGEGGPPNLFLEVVRPPVVPSIRKLS